ncbi:MAG: qor 4 [Myxococcales bacterium]|nr:qor 4 [Myxococcales bacterium]
MTATSTSTVTDQPRTMRAIGAPRIGALDKLGPVEVQPPSLTAGHVQVRVVASAVNPADLKIHRGEFAGRVLHARTTPLVTGFDFSGVVEACGDGVVDFAAGDSVFGFLPYSSSNRQGAFAERVVVDPAMIARKPQSITHEVAGAVATPGCTALQALRDKGRLREGGRVMILGAAGGVGSVAVGVARSLGAKVTAVCSTYAVDFVRELGADEVIDRKQQDPLAAKGPFEVVFDTAAAYSYASTRHMLTSDGAYVTTLPSAAWFGGKILAAASKRRCHMIIVASRRADLELLATWMAGGMRVPIDSRFPVRELGKALERQGRGEVRGRVAIDVENGF